ncbi:hypothetical protein [Deinococcus sp.]|uniref:antitoxin n=1 Tax=Deinococcus sp. TaxID=47478 RepID=UPI0028698926|nr:hypothetical protein [Deinococcus sp.]
MARSTTFKSGTSQAIRIPPELQLPHGEVEITRRGRSLVITPVDKQESGAILDREDEPPSKSERRALLERVAGSLARDDGRDMTRELLEERRREAEDKGW